MGLFAFGQVAHGEPVRFATYNVELARPGPGLLLGDIADGADDVLAAIDVIVDAAPDVLLLLGIDWDLDGQAVAALADRLAARGLRYPHRFAAQPNSGVPTGFDLDRNNRLGEPRDAQGYGEFTGQDGMALLSRLPIAGEPRDFSGLLWRDLPGATLPQSDGQPYYSDEITAILRLSTVGHWDVPLMLPDGGIAHLLAFHAGTPVFDGPEDRNGLRNRDEVRFWSLYLDGALGVPAPDGLFVIAGAANLDPADGAGHRQAIRDLLADARLQDPAPRADAAAEASAVQGGVNRGQAGDPALDTADWPDAPGEPGNLRVDYLLPSADWPVAGAGLQWPAPADPSGKVRRSRHALVWVDLGR